MDNRYNPQLIFLTDPDHLGFILADPDAPAVWPVRSHAGGREVVVSRHVVEEEMAFSHLLRLRLGDLVLVARGQAVVVTGDPEGLEDLHHPLLELQPLVLVHRWRQVPPLHVPRHSRSHRHLLELRVDLGQQVLSHGDVPVMRLLGVARDTVVLSGQRF